MASSLGIGCGGSNGVGRVEKFGPETRGNLGLRVMSLAVNDRGMGCRGSFGSVSMARTVTKATVAATSSMDLAVLGKFDEEGRRGNDTEVVDAYERLDEWMRKSVVDIVKNLKEAPLLVQVYQDKKSSDGAGRTTATLRTEKKAVEEEWPIMKEKWETGENPLPEGLIFVEEIGAGDEEQEESGDGKGGRRDETTTRAWGIVIQGNCGGCGPVCYLLKTSRVGAGSGIGLGVTHFCLVRVKNFTETVTSQLKNCWLLQGQ